MFRKGDLVISKNGRDKGRKLMVTEVVNENYVLIADGDLRKLQKPKMKKIKHLEYAGEGSYNGTLTNPALKKMLKTNSES